MSTTKGEQATRWVESFLKNGPFRNGLESLAMVYKRDTDSEISGGYFRSIIRQNSQSPISKSRLCAKRVKYKYHVDLLSPYQELFLSKPWTFCQGQYIRKALRDLEGQVNEQKVGLILHALKTARRGTKSTADFPVYNGVDLQVVGSFLTYCESLEGPSDDLYERLVFTLGRRFQECYEDVSTASQRDQQLLLLSSAITDLIEDVFPERPREVNTYSLSDLDLHFKHLSLRVQAEKETLRFNLTHNTGEFICSFYEKRLRKGFKRVLLILNEEETLLQQQRQKALTKVQRASLEAQHYNSLLKTLQI